MIKANDAKQQMERESLCRFYEEFKIITSKILSIFETFDEESLSNIQVITGGEHKSFLYELEIEKFLFDFKSALNLDDVSKKAYEKNNLIKEEMKIFDSYLNYLLNLFKDELSLDEYNLEAIFKSQMKELHSYLKDIRKAQTIESTILMGNNMVKKINKKIFNFPYFTFI